MDASDTGGNQHLRETSFTCRRTKRHTIQQDLRSRSAQKHTTAAAVIQRVAQFMPRRFELCRRSHVSKFIQPCKLQQNVQAADKRPRPASLFRTHICQRTTLPRHALPFTVGAPLSTVVSPTLRDKPPAAHCTHFNNRFPYRFGNIVGLIGLPGDGQVARTINPKTTLGAGAPLVGRTINH